MKNMLLRFSRRCLSTNKGYIDFEAKYNCQNYSPIPIVIKKGDGVWCWDVEGKKYLDCLSAYGALNHGHLHPRIKRVMIKQLDELTLTSRAVFNDKLGKGLEVLCKTLDYPKGIFMNTGVEAGETAVKFARRWSYEVKGVPDNEACVIFANGNFWGRTIAACGSSDDPDRFYHFGPFGLNFKLVDYNSIEALEKEFKSNPKIAAFMVEPIQGEGGVNIPDKDYLNKVRDLCTKYKVLLICDEVQTGLGRTGKMLCQEHNNVKADLVCLGKSLSGGLFPVSAVVGKKEIFDVIVPNSHGSTYGGNPLAAAVAVEALKVLKEEGLIENSRIMGDYLLKELKMAAKNNKKIKEVRGKGLFIAIETNEEKDAKNIATQLVEEGIITKPTRKTVLRICPPLIINEKECDFIVEKVKKVLKE